MAERIALQIGDAMPPGNWRVVEFPFIQQPNFGKILQAVTLERIPDTQPKPPAPPILLLPDGEPRAKCGGDGKFYTDAAGTLFDCIAVSHPAPRQHYIRATPAATGEQLRELANACTFLSSVNQKSVAACLLLADQLEGMA